MWWKSGIEIRPNDDRLSTARHIQVFYGLEALYYNEATYTRVDTHKHCTSDIQINTALDLDTFSRKMLAKPTSFDPIYYLTLTGTESSHLNNRLLTKWEGGKGRETRSMWVWVSKTNLETATMKYDQHEKVRAVI